MNRIVGTRSMRSGQVALISSPLGNVFSLTFQRPFSADRVMR